MALRPEHIKYINDRGITDPDVIEARGYESVDNGLKIPIYDIADGKQVNYEIRLDVEDKPGRKFTRPHGVGNRLNINPMMLWKVKSVKHLLFVVEGTTRADALAQQGIAAVSLTGVYGWISNKKDGTLADWKDLGLENRPVIFVPDGDVLSNKDVNRASHEFLDFMKRKNADARIAIMPDGQGLDDWLATGKSHADIHELTVDQSGLPRIAGEKVTPDTVAEKYQLPSTDDRTLAEAWVESDPTHAVSIAGTDRWWFYDGRVWMQDSSRYSKDAKASLYRFLARVAGVYEDAKAKGSDRKVADEVITDLRSARKLSNVYSAFASLGMGVASVREEDFDRDPYLFNVSNGTVNLRNGQLRGHNPGEYLRGASPTVYRADADTSRWERFLSEVFKGDTELIQWLQLVLGSALIGRTALQILPVLVGKGRNGKGTIVRALSNALGRDYMTTMDKSLLITNKYESHPTKLMALKGKRLVTASETEDGDKFAAASIKALTGGDEITARGMREDQQTFMPSHNMILMTNSLPEVDVSDEAMWARLKLVTFPVSFADNPDLNIDAKLAKEAEAILAWLVAGAVKFIQGGEQLPADPMSVIDATGNWRMQGNSLLEFLNLKVRKQLGSDIGTGELSEAYRKWAEQSGVVVLQTTAFSRVMEAAGFEAGRSKTRRYWKDVRWTTPSEEGDKAVTELVTELEPSSSPANPQVQAAISIPDDKGDKDIHTFPYKEAPNKDVQVPDTLYSTTGESPIFVTPSQITSSEAQSSSSPAAVSSSPLSPAGEGPIQTPWGMLDADLLDEYGRIKAQLTDEQVLRMNQQFQIKE